MASVTDSPKVGTCTLADMCGSGNGLFGRCAVAIGRRLSVRRWRFLVFADVFRRRTKNFSRESHGAPEGALNQLGFFGLMHIEGAGRRAGRFAAALIEERASLGQ